MSKRKKAAPKPRKARSSNVLAWLMVLLLAVLVYATFDLETVQARGIHPLLAPGDWVLMERLTPELGEVERGEVVAVKVRGSRGRRTIIGEIVAGEGQRFRGRRVERGHVVVGQGKGWRTVPMADVEAVARLRIRKKGERWALDLLGT